MKGIVISALIGILIGVLLLVIPVGLLINLAFIVFGVLTLISAVPAFILSLLHREERGYLLNIILSAISVLFGIVLIFWHNEIVMILLGVYMLIFPLIRILVSDAKKQQLRRELPRMILGLVMILVGPGTVIDLLLRVAGWVVIALSVLYAAFGLLSLHVKVNKAAEKTGGRIFVDADGDGTPDTVYVDTTGDGKPDTHVKLDEGK